MKQGFSSIDKTAPRLHIHQNLQQASTDPDRPIIDDCSLNARTALTLSNLMLMIEGNIKSGFPESVWVQAEVVEYKKNPSGHVYLELIERDQANAARPKAKVRGNIWADSVPQIVGKFNKDTNSELRAGMSILVRARVAFSPTFGLALVVLDIDPTFTIGAMAAHVAQIKKRLADEKIIDLNRRLTRPSDVFRVAVVAPNAAAGLGDFKHEADILQKFNVTEFLYFTAVFQGDKASETISSAVAKAGQSDVDLIVILRGGGATADLQYLNDYRIARSICMAPVPVIVGIGHEKDKTLLDDVANSSLGTPSKVAGFIASILEEKARRGRDCIAAIQSTATSAVLKKRERAQRCISSIQNGASVIAVKYRQRAGEGMRQVCMQSQQLVSNKKRVTQQLIIDIKRDVHQVTSKKRADARQLMVNMRRDVELLTAERRNTAKMLCVEIYGQRVGKTLSRGFALATNSNNKVITSAASALNYDEINLVFHDGQINVGVIK